MTGSQINTCFGFGDVFITTNTSMRMRKHQGMDIHSVALSKAKELIKRYPDSYMDDKKIIIYSLSTCVHCKDTINYIAKKGLEFSFIDIDILEKKERKKMLENLKKINPECTFPTTAIGDKTIIGFEVDHLEEALNS